MEDQTAPDTSHRRTGQGQGLDHLHQGEKEMINAILFFVFNDKTNSILTYLLKVNLMFTAHIYINLASYGFKL